MTLDDAFFEALAGYLQRERSQAHRVWHYLLGMQRAFLLRSDVQDVLVELCAPPDGDSLRNSPLHKLLGRVQEAAVDAPWIYLALRVRVGCWEYMRVHLDTMSMERISVSNFLYFKEHLINGSQDAWSWELEIDLEPFSREFPKMHETRSIGRGVEFLNRRLSSRLFEDLGKGDQRLLDFLRVHSYREQQLMLNEVVRDVPGLRSTLRAADDYLAGVGADADYGEVYSVLRAMGFEPGWGRDATRMRETMQLLLDILEAPSPGNLE